MSANNVPTVNPSGGRGWLDEWMAYAKSRATMTDELMIEATGLFLMASVVAGRAKIRLDFSTIYTNLYVMLVAPTTYYHKSTILRLAQSMLASVAPHLLLPSQMSPEMMFNKLAGQAPTNIKDLPPEVQAQETMGQLFCSKRSFITDEASKLFRSKYLEAMADWLLDLYDCPDKLVKEFKDGGQAVVYNPSLSLLFATTPANMNVIIPNEGDTGFMPRFAMITPSADKVERVHNKRADEVKVTANNAIDGLKALYNFLPMPEKDNFECVDMGITDEALLAYNLYADFLHDACAPDSDIEDRLRGTYGRLAVMGMKVAMLLAIGHGRKFVTLDDWGHAQNIVEKWRASAHRVRKAMVNSVDVQTEKDIIRYLRGAKVLQTAVDIYRAIGGDRRQVERTIKSLQDGGVIELVEASGKKGYRFVSIDGRLTIAQQVAINNGNYISEWS